MRTFAMMILGCKVNDYEATVLKNRLLEHGYKEVSFKEKADIYVIFTCCVTNTAESKTRKMVHRARNTNPDAFVVAVGCLVQIKGDSYDFDCADLIVGSKDKDKLFDLIDNNVKSKVVSPLTNEFKQMELETYPGKSRAFLKVQDGCNQFCAYCIIPYARGRETSGNHEKIVEQAIKLSKTSKELVLVGIHTGRYFDGEYHLYDLLKDLIKIDTLETIRLSSIEVTEITDEIIDLMANSDKLAHHLHIPLQSGSDEILKLMHRPYTMKEYKDRIAYIRKRIPDVSISCDLIVGFPNETDELFKETINNIKEIGFSFIHVFPYARKTGTVADKMDGHVPEIVKKERLYKVEEVQKEYTRRFNSSFVGKQLKMLVEKCEDGYVYGYTKQYFYVSAKGDASIGEVIDVIIDSVNDDEVVGHVSR